MTFVKFLRMGAAVGALSVVGIQANAADLSGFGSGYGGFKDGPVYAPSIWSGFYAGVNGGYGWRQTFNEFAYPTFGGVGASGGFGGGQLGYSWQGAFGAPLVAGIETDIQGSDIAGKTVNSAAETFKTRLDWFGTVRGRLGYASSNALVYFTGGFAYGELKQHGEDNVLYAPPAIYASRSDVTGYVLGGGLEYKFNPSWSVKAEYQYLNFGKHDAPLVSGAGPATLEADGRRLTDDAFHTVRIGLNYWVSPTYEPLK